MLCLSLVRVSLCNSGRHLIAPQGIESLKMNVLCIVLEKAVKKVGSNILIQCMKYTQCTEEITPFLFSTLCIPFSLFWHRLEHSTNFVSPLKLARAAWWCWTLSGLCCCSSRSRVIQKNTSGRRGSYLQAFAYIFFVAVFLDVTCTLAGIGLVLVLLQFFPFPPLVFFLLCSMANITDCLVLVAVDRTVHEILSFCIYLGFFYLFSHLFLKLTNSSWMYVLLGWQE